MLVRLRRHPFAVEAFFRFTLVLTYAFPEDILKPLLSPGLTLDSYDGQGFLAIALVQTEHLRPAGLPERLGRAFFLSGYRIFSRFRRPDGKILRGLKILRSDADDRLMVLGGQLMTHYGYSLCQQTSTRTATHISIQIQTPQQEADLRVRARIDRAALAPPAGSPFPDLKVARRFAGPLPHTFGYEAETQQMVIVRGNREGWTPLPVEVECAECLYLKKPFFQGVQPRLANAFFMENIPYRWERGVVVPIVESPS